MPRDRPSAPIEATNGRATETTSTGQVSALVISDLWFSILGGFEIAENGIQIYQVLAIASVAGLARVWGFERRPEVLRLLLHQTLHLATSI